MTHFTQNIKQECANMVMNALHQSSYMEGVKATLILKGAPQDEINEIDSLIKELDKANGVYQH